jgi:hypothetical protein
MRRNRHNTSTAPHLPDELIELVVLNLVPSVADYKHADVQTLASLSVVNRQWHRVVEPYLYCHIQIPKRGSETNLAETLTNEPAFTPYIKTLVGSHTLLTDYLPPSGITLIPFEQSMEELLEDKRRKYLNRQYLDLVSTLPNLEILDVSEPSHELSYQDGEQVPPWLALMHWVPSSPPNFSPKRFRYRQAFQNLKRLDAAIHDIPFDELYHVFRLPAIETLHFTGGDMRDTTMTRHPRHIMGWNFKSDTIKHLAFYDPVPLEGFMGMHGVFYIAQTLTCLESLAFVGPKDGGFGANMHRAIMARFQDSITNARFRKLEMWDRRTTRANKRTALRFDGAVRRFATVSSVEEMALDSEILESLWSQSTATVMLPLKLRRLHIRSSRKWTLELYTRLVRLLVDMSGKLTLYPSLREVSVALQAGDRIGEKALKTAAKAFTAMGIHFTMSKKEDCAWDADRFVDTISLLARKRC